jgi:putative transposase
MTKPGVRGGVDLGLRTLATVVGTDGTIREFDNPAPLRATMADRRRTSRKLSRRIPGSRGHEQAKAKLAKLDRRAVHLRREAWHQLTSWLGATYCEVVIEDLDVAAMKKSMGRRAFRRAVSDAALGMFAPMLAYKAQRSGTIITVADRWSPSSKLHHGCGCTLIAPTKLARRLICQVTGGPVDRDINAAKNLRDYKGPVRAEAPVVSSPTVRGGGAGPGVVKDQHRESGCKTRASRPAVRSEARTKTPQGDAA